MPNRRLFTAAAGCVSIACCSVFAVANWDDPRLRRRAAAGSSGRPLTLGTYDFVVVGGGVVGLAIARQFMIDFPKKTVCVLEKEPAVGQHQTSHNSGVVHAGLYDPPSTLIGRLCPRGAAMLRQYCADNGLPFAAVGKFIVATDESQRAALEELRDRGVANGARDLEIVDGAALRAREPNVAGVAALWSPHTAVADFAAVARCLALEVTGAVPAKGKARGAGQRRAGGTVLCNYRVTGFEGFEDRVRVHGEEPGQGGPAKAVDGRIVVTSAGLNMDTVAAAAGGASLPRVVAFRGRYWQLKPEKRDLVSSNIYPVPGRGGIPVGIHFSPTVNEQRGRQLIVGPGTALCLSREAYTAASFSPVELARVAGSAAFWHFAAANLTSVTRQVWQDLSKAAFLRDAQRLVPSLRAEDLEPSFTGVMAQVFTPRGQRMPDYVFEVNAAPVSPAFAAAAVDDVAPEEAVQQAVVCPRRVLSIRSLPSPAGTACLAIAEHVSQLVQSDPSLSAGLSLSLSPPS